MVLKESTNYKGGKKLAGKRQNAKRRHLGFILLTPLKEGEVSHHVTNIYVIGIPKEAHEKCNGNREGHRRKVLKWLKFNDRRKYSLVIAIFKNNRST